MRQVSAITIELSTTLLATQGQLCTILGVYLIFSLFIKSFKRFFILNSIIWLISKYKINRGFTG